MALGAALLGAVLTLAAARPAWAAGEPTLTILMNPTSLTLGTTSQVTFQFSAVPIGFDNSDVNLSDANGTLSTVTPGGDARVWTATFTPNAGVNDATNTISVGVQWTDSVGVSPLGPSTGPNYTIATAAATSSACPPPSLYVASPKGGEIFVAGTAVDVFWTANGCQLASVLFALSVDGGVSYGEPFATSSTPFSGHYRWTVPDVDATYARLRLTLMGQGGVEFASDETDGTFTIFPSSPPAPAEEAAAASTSTQSPPPEEPPPPEAVAATEGGTPTASEPAPAEAPATTIPPSRPRERQATAAKPAVTAPTVAAPPAESPQPAPEPPDATTTEEVIPSTMPETNENQGEVLENAQVAVETAAQFAPSSMELGFSFVLGALAMLAAMLGARKVMRDIRDKQGRTCTHCHGTGEKAKYSDSLEACGDCGGSGTVEEEDERSVECAHCGGEGTDPCHECEGEGKDASGAECEACGGSGLTPADPDDENSDEPADCEMCGGEGEIGATLKKQVSCETCHGTGKV